MENRLTINHPVWTAIKNRSAGFSLLELLAAVAVLSFVTFSIIILNLTLLRSQVRTTSLFQLTVVAQNFVNLVSNEQAWKNTINAQANATTMACLKSQSPCTQGGQSNGNALQNIAFVLFDGANNPVYDATNPASGFTMWGAPCTTFSTKGNDACPFRYNLQWSAQCTIGNCVNPQVLVSATLVYAPATNPIVLNPANYSMPATYRNAQ